MAKTSSKTSSTSPKRRATSEAPTPVTKVVARPRPTHEQIAARAFELYQLRAPAEGNAISDWLKAERELIR